MVSPMALGSAKEILHTPTMSSPSDILSTPLVLPSHKLSHRIVLAPMTRMRAAEDGVPDTKLMSEYYAQRATMGGLMISEGAVVNPRGKGFPNTPGLWNEEQVEAWKGITQTVRDKGGVFFAQIWHVGRVSVPSQIGGLPPLASVTTPLPGTHALFGSQNVREAYVPSQAMDEADVAAVLRAFSTAAKNAIRAGFDGVEIHSGNGYLLDTFLHSNINNRTDKYGGSVENRVRFPLEVVDAVISAVGSDRVGVRIAPFHVLQGTRDANRLETFGEYTRELEKRRVAYVHIVEPRYDQLSTEGAFSSAIQRGRGGKEEPKEKVESVEFSIWPFRHILKHTILITAGGFDADCARSVINEGRADAVAFGRHFTSNPDLPRRLMESLPLGKYDRKTFYTPGRKGLVDFPPYSEVSGI